MRVIAIKVQPNLVVSLSGLRGRYARAASWECEHDHVSLLEARDCGSSTADAGLR